MKTLENKQIRKRMKKWLTEERFEHTLGVAYTAAALAMCHGVPVGNAETAGLLHDCAKCIPDEKKIAICEKHNIPINDIERRNPFLLHAKVGSYLAMDEFHISNPDIVNAILNHTTGRPGMSTLEKIIFISDYIEPNRKKAPHLSEIRQIAFRNLDEAMLRILEDTLTYLAGQGNEIDPMTQKTYDYYKQGENGYESI